MDRNDQKHTSISTGDPIDSRREVHVEVSERHKISGKRSLSDPSVLACVTRFDTQLLGEMFYFVPMAKEIHKVDRLDDANVRFGLGGVPIGVIV
jgi:hypothetical protein